MLFAILMLVDVYIAVDVFLDVVGNINVNDVYILGVDVDVDVDVFLDIGGNINDS